ncbi:MAG: hypothetical protein STSR0007_02860 [Thermovirga sp.]
MRIRLMFLVPDEPYGNSLNDSGQAVRAVQAVLGVSREYCNQLSGFALRSEHVFSQTQWTSVKI